MNLKQYKEYLKNNPKGYWFKRKLYGWGWFPVRWQGWLVVLAFVMVLIFDAIYIDTRVSLGREPSSLDFAIFFGILIISVIAVLFISYRKGEKPGWSWGLKK